MMLHQIQKRLQATFTQPALHTFEPLRGVVHLRRHSANHYQRFCPLLRCLLHRYGITNSSIQIVHAVQYNPCAVEPGNRAGGSNEVEPVLPVRRKIAGRVIIAPTGAHIKCFPCGKQALGVVHRQRHMRCSRIHQPVEIDQISPTHKTHRVKKFASGGVTHNNFAAVTGLVTEIG